MSEEPDGSCHQDDDEDNGEKNDDKGSNVRSIQRRVHSIQPPSTFGIIMILFPESEIKR